MALINFPSIPNLPGVPDLRRVAISVASRTGLLGVLSRIDRFGVLSSILAQQWGVYDRSGNLAIVPDSVIGLEYRGEYKIAIHPVEQGMFASYNKVKMPYDIRMTMTCSGARGFLSELALGYMQKGDFIEALEIMNGSLEQFVISTPDYAYPNANLVRFDYARTSTNGVSLLTVDLYFQEVRETASATQSSSKKSVEAATPTASQSQIISGGVIQ